MQWYYAINGQRHGPVAHEEFERLVSAGTIKPDTLVWRAGMANWQAYAAAIGGTGSSATGAPAGVPGVAEAAPGADDTEVCAVSGKRYPRREMIQYEGKWIGAEHRDRFFQQLREGVPVSGISGVPGPYGYGGFWRRFLAYLVDGIILWVVGSIVQLAVGAAFGIAGGLNPQPGNSLPRFFGYFAVVMTITMAIQLSYYVGFIRKFDATPGKMALGVKLVRSDGSKLSTLRIIGRFFAQMLSTMILFIGYIMAAFDEEKRSLHDRICDTRVIKTR